MKVMIWRQLCSSPTFMRIVLIGMTVFVGPEVARAILISGTIDQRLLEQWTDDGIMKIRTYEESAEYLRFYIFINAEWRNTYNIRLSFTDREKDGLERFGLSLCTEKLASEWARRKWSDLEEDDGLVWHEGRFRIRRSELESLAVVITYAPGKPYWVHHAASKAQMEEWEKKGASEERSRSLSGGWAQQVFSVEGHRLYELSK